MRTVRFAPRLPLRRLRRPDLFFAQSDPRWEAAVADIKAEYDKGRPVLVGTRSVEKSRLLSGMLEEAGVPHRVLNAVDHAKEAEIIAEAGQRGSVTVATKMAGRGVEIKLGEGVEDLGGMHVLGTERHTLVRVDRQLGGRCGRRGQPGTIQFYGSLDDDILEILPERRRRGLKRRHASAGSRPIASHRMTKLFDRVQAMFAARFAQIRRMLLVQDLAQEEADRILFGQQNL
jgi:preprotein translocase subunit SecA